MFSRRKIAEIEFKIKDLEELNRILKNCGRSLCVAVRDYKYGRRAAQRYNENVRSL